MKNGKEGVVREIMMGNPVTLKPDGYIGFGE